eukprot:4112376-Prymnesium_polylepis.1
MRSKNAGLGASPCSCGDLKSKRDKPAHGRRAGFQPPRELSQFRAEGQQGRAVARVGPRVLTDKGQGDVLPRAVGRQVGDVMEPERGEQQHVARADRRVVHGGPGNRRVCVQIDGPRIKGDKPKAAEAIAAEFALRRA